MKNRSYFLKKAKIIHKNKYGYNKVLFLNLTTKVSILCKKHKKYFTQAPNKHLLGQGCPLCAGIVRYTREAIIAEFKYVHGDKYEYTKTNYLGIYTKVAIYCKKHKDFFWQRPKDHLNGQGCRKCGLIKCAKSHTYDTAFFIKKSIKIHGDNYGYDSVIYKNSTTKVKIYCKKHKKYFNQMPSHHLYGKGCPECKSVNAVGFLPKHIPDDQKKSLCYLYYLKITEGKNKFFKIGISNDVDRRLADIRRQIGSVELLYFFKGTRYKMACLEHKLKKDFVDFKLQPKGWFDGMTECFGMDILMIP